MTQKAALIGLFGLLGLVISAVGIYGVMGYAVSQRTREIGIRMALGASRSSVMRMVLSNAGLMVGTGLAIGALVLYSSLGILRESANILLEGRPRETRVEEVAKAILAIENVQEVHDVHVWCLGGDHLALSCHARIPDMHMDECEKIILAIQKKVLEEFGIGHATVQLERAGLPATSGYVMPEPARKP